MYEDTFKSLLPVFIQDLEKKGRSPSTILAYQADLQQLIKFLEAKSKVQPTSVTGDDITSFRDTLMNKRYTPKTVSRKLNAIKTFFRYLIDQKKLTQDPTDGVTHPKTTPSIPSFLSPIEYRALRDVVRDDVRVMTIIELILQAGLRISEVAKLEIENVLEDKLIIKEHATQPPRDVPLNDSAIEAVDKYKPIRPDSPSPYLFVSKNGKPLAVRNIRAAIDRYLQKAEIPQYSVNDLRTTFIVENLKRGVDLVFLSQVVGHKRLSTTERYLELAEIDKPGTKHTLEEL